MHAPNEHKRHLGPRWCEPRAHNHVDADDRAVAGLVDVLVGVSFDPCVTHRGVNLGHQFASMAWIPEAPVFHLGTSRR